MTIDMSQFYQVFFEETAEHLADMESLLLGLDVGDPDDEQLNAIFRAAHSIKGSSGTFGFTDLAEVTHVLENLLDRIRKHELALRTDMVDAFLEAGDTLKGMLAAHQGGAPVAADAVDRVCGNLRALTRADAPAAAAAPEPPPPAAVPPAAAAVTYDIELLPTIEATADAEALSNLLDELASLGELDVLARPAAGTPGLWRLRLCTAAPREDFEDALEFVSERDAWRVSVAAADLVDAGGAFGLFVPPEAAASEAYGFFEPVAGDAAPAVVEEGDGFGFFAPLPEAEAPPPAAAVPVAEEGDGYGLFEAPAAAVVEAAPPPPALLPKRPRSASASSAPTS